MSLTSGVDVLSVKFTDDGYNDADNSSNGYNYDSIGVNDFHYIFDMGVGCILATSSTAYIH